jgi:transposase
MIRDVDALRDDQWDRLKDLVPGGRAGERGPRCDNRRFVDALLWMARSGGRWRDLPERLGDHQAVKRRYYRWIERGALDEFLAALTTAADLEWLMIDSTIVRAHQHAAGARIAKGGGCPGFGAIPRRLEHQDTCRCRRARQSRPSVVRARSAQRYYPGTRTD